MDADDAADDDDWSDADEWTVIGGTTAQSSNAEDDVEEVRETTSQSEPREPTQPEADGPTMGPLMAEAERTMVGPEPPQQQHQQQQQQAEPNATDDVDPQEDTPAVKKTRAKKSKTKTSQDLG